MPTLAQRIKTATDLPARKPLYLLGRERARIDAYLELPDWSRRFTNWRTRCRLETLVTCAKRAAEAGQSVADIRFQALKREYVYNGEHPLAFNPEGEGWCHALTIDRLHREGLQGSYWGYGASRLDLAGELAALLWAELNLECGTIPAVTEQSIVIARLFETWAHQREGRLLHHLGDLKRHLSREIEAWH